MKAPVQRTDVPRATVRLQLHRGFTFDDARGLVGYFAKLGISHIYTSPILKARPGSTHGYDVVDVTQVNPELGGEPALRALSDALRAAGMGLIVDIVPNHMGVGGSDNTWWQDVLESGQASRYASHFDIDWQSADPVLRGKLLAPFLGNGYGEVLVSGELVLEFDDSSNRFAVRYFAHRFPIAPAAYAELLASAGSQALVPVIVAYKAVGTALLSGHRGRIADTTRTTYAEAVAAAHQRLAALLADPATRTPARADIDAALTAHAPTTPQGLARLHALLERQHYRLASWRTAADEINWRRFFEVTDLAGVRVERPEVFEAMHAKFFELYAAGVIDGVRVDHVDGLVDPRAYCRTLRRRLVALAKRRSSSPWSRPYIVVEKILASDERLREDWRLDGTTGYDFMDRVGALLHDENGAAPLAASWTRVTGRPAEFRVEVLAARRQILAENLAAEFNAASVTLHRVARGNVGTRDIALTAIRRVFTELLVHMPVYRTYAGLHGRDAADDSVLKRALAEAEDTVRPSDRPVLAWLERWLGGEAPTSLTETGNPTRRGDRLRAITRFQQLTPPLAAKSVEDTAFYRYGRLISRNEVGSDPGEFALAADAFHARCIEAAERFPYAMLATATHDHKRGEDARARLAILSEIPDRWAEKVERWTADNTPDQSLSRSTLLTFPFKGRSGVSDGMPSAAERKPACGRSSEAGMGMGFPNEDTIRETAPLVPPAGLTSIANVVARTAPVPLPEDQLMLYQTLVGAWPLELAHDAQFDAFDDKARITKLTERVGEWQTKALRETKRPSDWSTPNEPYEAMCRAFLEHILTRDDGAFARELAGFVDGIAAAAAINGLAQMVLRLTCPGVPDLYQGCEWWDFSLVDPDNRRPVDYAARIAALDRPAPLGELMTAWRDGRIKQSLLRSILAFRKQHAALFATGRYLPLAIEGAYANHALAFLRRDAHDTALVVVTRLAHAMLASRDVPHVMPSIWGDTAVRLLPIASRGTWRDVSTGARSEPSADGRLNLKDALSDLPIAVLLMS